MFIVLSTSLNSIASSFINSFITNFINATIPNNAKIPLANPDSNLTNLPRAIVAVPRPTKNAVIMPMFLPMLFGFRVSKPFIQRTKMPIEADKAMIAPIATAKPPPDVKSILDKAKLIPPNTKPNAAIAPTADHISPGLVCVQSNQIEPANIAIAAAIVNIALAFIDKLKLFIAPLTASSTPLKCFATSPKSLNVSIKESKVDAIEPSLAIPYTKLPPNSIVRISPIPTLSRILAPIFSKIVTTLSLNVFKVSKAVLNGPVTFLFKNVSNAFPNILNHFLSVLKCPSKSKKYPITFLQKSLTAILTFSNVSPSSCLVLSIKSRNASIPPLKYSEISSKTSRVIEPKFSIK